MVAQRDPLHVSLPECHRINTRMSGMSRVGSMQDYLAPARDGIIVIKKRSFYFAPGLHRD